MEREGNSREHLAALPNIFYFVSKRHREFTESNFDSDNSFFMKVSLSEFGIVFCWVFFGGEGGKGVGDFTPLMDSLFHH